MKKHILAIVALSFSAFSIQPVVAASEDECAIWLCAPGGFPAGCEAAKSALKHRLKKGKPPLPSFSACAVKDETTGTDPKDFTYEWTHVIRIREHEICSSERGIFRDCKMIPAHDKHGYSCYIKHGKDDEEYIKGCIGAFVRIKVFEKGQQLGETYYFQ